MYREGIYFRNLAREIRIMVFEPNGKNAEINVRSFLQKGMTSAELLDGKKVNSFGPHKIGWIELR